MKISTKVLLAVALVIMSVAGFATPASATSPVEVTGGTQMTVLYPFVNLPLFSDQGALPCPAKPSTLQLTTTTGPDRWTLSGGASVQFQHPPGSGNWFQIDRTIFPGSGGAWAGTAPTQALTGVIGMQIQVYQLQPVGGPLTCAKTNLRCIITAAYTLAATSTYKAAPGSPGLPSTTTSDSATVDAASGPTVTSSCAPPWNSIGATTTTLNNLQLTVQ
jgi:hypothetical protein